MKLIKEITEEINVVIEESTTGNKNYFIEGVFLQGNLKNRNGRIYPIDVLREEVNRYTKEYINTGRAMGELSHPENPSINLERVSHLIKELRQDGSNFIGRAKVLDTPYGKIVKSLMDEGVKLGVSSRGLGTLEERNGVNYVGNDFKLVTAADIVADPSAPDAFVRGVMENKEWVYDNGIIKEKEIEQIKAKISKSSVRQLEEIAIREFEKFLRKI